MKTRTENEMLALIIGFAKADDRIRAAVMNGSRVNPNVTKDMFQDYDVAAFVTDVEPFKDEGYVTSHFGKAILVQTPEAKACPPPMGDGSYNYNMQLADGNRIDLSFSSIDALQDRLKDSLTEVLIDKDGLMPNLPPASERSYFIEEPTQQLYEDCCDQFLFGLGSHIPKTFWRKQLPLLKFFIQVDLRGPLIMMLGWDVGLKTGFHKSIGKSGRYLQEHLEPGIWREFEHTYAGSDYDGIWESLLTFHRLFTRTAQCVGQHYGYRFPAEDAEGALAFLEHVRKLPDDAHRYFRCCVQRRGQAAPDGKH